MSKSADAFRTISEVADWLGIPAHVLRFWESKFTQVKPVKRAGGRRYYRPADMQLLGGIRKLLHDEGMTIKGVQKVMREQGVHHVAAMSPPLDGDLDTDVAGIALDVPEVEPRGQIVNFGRPQAEAPAPSSKVQEPAKNDSEPTDIVLDVQQENVESAPVSPEPSVEDTSPEDTALQEPADLTAPEPAKQTEDTAPSESAASDQAAPITEAAEAAYPSDAAPPEHTPDGDGSATSEDTQVEDEAPDEVSGASPEPTPKRMAQPVDPEDEVVTEAEAPEAKSDTRPRVEQVQTADDPSDTEPAPASALTHLAAYDRKPKPQDAARIADIANRLTDLRSRMSGNAKTP
ncbi:MerR family transcriptional regulator [Roseovarius arcticus]|uniref:MerR family transcriptional regulator n=1 Tax=Roseovarius arcticus TaxID=2547404 RepID=UPI001110FA4A|nr:MerR family transcriptional regulator [Roseovarius arcticus]